uniref:Uncharacterized protein n=1 Tax=Nomascus leucogenys TaxID=61853 RepID=A0A2I3GPT1_NOMLE
MSERHGPSPQSVLLSLWFLLTFMPFLFLTLLSCMEHTAPAPFQSAWQTPGLCRSSSFCVPFRSSLCRQPWQPSGKSLDSWPSVAGLQPLGGGHFYLTKKWN